ATKRKFSKIFSTYNAPASGAGQAVVGPGLPELSTAGIVRCARGQSPVVGARGRDAPRGVAWTIAARFAGLIAAQDVGRRPGRAPASRLALNVAVASEVAPSGCGRRCGNRATPCRRT